MSIEPQPSRSSLSRQDWIDRFQQVASQNELTDDLVSLVNLLGLPISCSLAVYEVLRQGNWKTAQRPKPYMKKASMNQARKMHLSIPLKDDTLECGERALVFMDGKELDEAGTRKGTDDENGAWWREHEAAEKRNSWPSDCWTKRALYAKNHDGILVRVGSTNKRDWRKLGQRVELDPWQIKVLEYRSQGISRDEAMKMQPDEGSRKAIQAAWKRMDRSGWSKVKQLLSENLPEDVPDEHFRDTREMGAVGMSVEGRKAFQAAWKRTGGKSREDLGRFLTNYRAANFGRGPTKKLLHGGVCASASCMVKIIDLECPE